MLGNINESNVQMESSFDGRDLKAMKLAFANSGWKHNNIYFFLYINGRMKDKYLDIT